MRFGYDDANEAADYIGTKLEERGLNRGDVNTGLILGSGLGGFGEAHLNQHDTDASSRPLIIPYAEIYNHLGIPGYENYEAPKKGKIRETVKGHAKKLIIGPLYNQKGEKQRDDHLVIGQSGREHPYEGISLRRATFWVRVMQMLQTQQLLSSNASGVVTPHTLDITNGPLLMMHHSDRDLTNTSPLWGLNDDRLGPRFPHKGDKYTTAMRTLIRQQAESLGIDLREGLYFRNGGPYYESAEEVYELRGKINTIWSEGGQQEGDDRFKGNPVGVVGMSTIYEMDVAQHAKQSKSHPAFQNGTGAISMAGNYSSALSAKGFVEDTTHEEVGEAAKQVEGEFNALVFATLVALEENRRQS